MTRTGQPAPGLPTCIFCGKVVLLEEVNGVITCQLCCDKRATVMVRLRVNPEDVLPHGGWANVEEVLEDGRVRVLFAGNEYVIEQKFISMTTVGALAAFPKLEPVWVFRPVPLSLFGLTHEDVKKHFE